MSSAEHETFAEDVGAYLLGALSEEEAEAFEAHMTGCARCREELEQLRPAAEALPRSAEPVAPPARLRASVMSRVRDEAAAASAPSRRTRRARGWWAARPLARRPLALVAGVMCLLALAGVGGFALAGRLQGPTERTVAARIDRLRAPNARARLVIPADRGEVAYLRVQGFPPLRRGRVYEVWVKRGGETVPQSLFTVSSGGTGTAGVNDGLDDVDAVLVTEEREGGSRAPTKGPMLVAKPS